MAHAGARARTVSVLTTTRGPPGRANNQLALSSLQNSPGRKSDDEYIVGRSSAAEFFRFSRRLKSPGLPQLAVSTQLALWGVPLLQKHPPGSLLEKLLCILRKTSAHTTQNKNPAKFALCQKKDSRSLYSAPSVDYIYI